MSDSTDLNETETRCLRILARMLAEGRTTLDHELGDVIRNELAVSPEEFELTWRMLTQHGAIEKVITDSPIGSFSAWRISAHVISIVRQIDQQEKQSKEPRDIVERIGESARKNRVMGLIIIGFMVLTAIMVFVAAALTIIDKVLDLQKKLGV